MNISALTKKSLALLEGVDNLEQLKKAHKDLLGKNGEVNLLLKKLGTLPPSKRKSHGKDLNNLKNQLEEIFQFKQKNLKKDSSEKLKGESIDVTLPGRLRTLGSKHPVNSTISSIVSFFSSVGFEVVFGPEVESDYYNFESLNIPKNHPAKDMHDTFYLENGFLLRTHTSPVQIRAMEKLAPPIRIICPGKAYRRDSDLTHTPMFHQIEGLVIDKEASFSVLKGLLYDFVINLFGKETEIRFRPSYFPFTEPSAEVDIKWKKGWLEILGCGMVHPNVLKKSGINTNIYSGFAFGLGPERIAMLQHNIPDIRAFFENDIRFLKQF